LLEIYFSRHARRRKKLYGISEDVIIDILKDKQLSKGNQEIIENVEGFKFPLKVVFVVTDKITIITTYPLKKGRA